MQNIAMSNAVKYIRNIETDFPNDFQILKREIAFRYKIESSPDKARDYMQDETSPFNAGIPLKL